MKTHLGHYEIVAELGRGGMGVVYKGFEPALNRHVAIKELSPSLAHDPNLVERFLREARSMAALSDPHIIQVYFIGTDEATQQPFFAMEFVDGDSLSGLLKREGKLSVENTLKILHQTAQGLATAHDKGVIHRDIKPGNLMLTTRGQVKIADFGIALATQDISKKLTSTGEFVGTPGYLSPEVCLGKIVDQRSDIFSLGIVMFEMLSGKTPFSDESPLGLMLEVVKAEIPDIRGINAEVDPQTAAILTRMVAKEPADRFQSCHDLAAALEAHPLVAKGGTVKFAVAKAAPSDATVVGAPTPASLQQRAPTPPPVVRAATPVPVAPPAPPAGPPTGRSAQRPSVLARDKKSSPVLPLAIAAALVLVLAGGAYAFRGPLGDFARGFGEGFTGSTAAYDSGKATGKATNPVGTSVAANPATDPAATASTALTASNGSSTATVPQTPDASETPVERPASIPVAPVPGGDASMAAATPASQAPAAVAPPATPAVAVDAPAKQVASAQKPREVIPPPPPRVAVVALGDSAITGPARQRIEERLADAGFDIFDAEVSGATNRGDLAGVLSALRRDAAVVIVVKAEPVGSEFITYYGQSSELFTANLNVRAYTVQDKRPVGVGFREKVQFTTLNADTKAEEAVSPRLDRLLGELSAYRPRGSRG
ncbi:serine/threonine-protein kinase [Chiayiivirga flava]|uniref:non-specific serine/threonine protein kinase n=1 Tax=Chiayiivirga flava TaxID=659595 RepID=A0A7W8D6G8_9GAMM|nr:serine/threonine-protein kinase [Chiayiivirga flava]MBB5207572.1 serine/threonine-protein kinase [Chiayiivirga flava]